MSNAENDRAFETWYALYCAAGGLVIKTKAHEIWHSACAYMAEWAAAEICEDLAYSVENRDDTHARGYIQGANECAAEIRKLAKLDADREPVRDMLTRHGLAHNEYAGAQDEIDIVTGKPFAEDVEAPPEEYV